MTDRVEQGKPELLGVLLVALHLDDGEPMRPARTARPRAQQRCLPAAGGGRDDRHLPRRRAIQRGEEIAPVDQPGDCWSHLQRPALVLRLTPCRRRHGPSPLPSRHQASVRARSTAREHPRAANTCPRSWALPLAPDRYAKAGAVRVIDPVRRCRPANHHDPVTTSYLRRSSRRRSGLEGR